MDVPEVAEIGNVMQLIYAAILVVAVLVVPQVIGLIQNRTIKRQNEKALTTLTTNNGGSTVKDAMDRLERGQAEQKALLTEHIEQSNARYEEQRTLLTEHIAESGERFEELERGNGTRAN